MLWRQSPRIGLQIADQAPAARLDGPSPAAAFFKTTSRPRPRRDACVLNDGPLVAVVLLYALAAGAILLLGSAGR